MSTAERVVREAPRLRSEPEPQRPRLVQKVPSPQAEASPGKPSLLWRLIFFFIGLGMVSLGWPLVVSAVGAFIGIPLIIVGLALMQAQEK